MSDASRHRKYKEQQLLESFPLLKIPSRRLARGPPAGSTGSVAQTAVLIDYLRQLERQGLTHVPVDEEARAILRGYFKAKAPQPGRSSATATAPQPAAAVAEAPPVATLTPTGTTRTEQLASLRAQAETWEPARSLGTLRDTMVFAVGNPEAPIVFVGEAPGYEEELRREPLVGKAGEKFNAILVAMGLSREQVYISNICKFRPALKNQTTTNRKPTREEMHACLPFVRAEIGIIKPKCIVALGATAAEGLLDSTETVGHLRGSWHEFEGIPLRVTYHPSYLLHTDAALPEKRKVWDDMLCLMEFLGMPISEKQRGFFLPKR